MELLCKVNVIIIYDGIIRAFHILDLNEKKRCSCMDRGKIIYLCTVYFHSSSNLLDFYKYFLFHSVQPQIINIVHIKYSLSRAFIST